MMLNGRTLLVTGGASGLGRAVVEMVVAGNGRAVIADLNGG
jgi:NAD(P)-dependent dehydrogenase (short-subunit alcohol dehydrogenase family)